MGRGGMDSFHSQYRRVISACKHIKEIFIVALCILINAEFTNQQMHFFILKHTIKFTLKYTKISLLHISVFEHHQGACTEPG